MCISDPRSSPPGCLPWLMKIWFLNWFFSRRPSPASFFEARRSLSPSPRVGPRQSSRQECSRGTDRCGDGENLGWKLRDLVLPSEPPSCLCHVWKGQNPERWHSSHFRYLLHCEAEAWVVPHQGSKPEPLKWGHGVLPSGPPETPGEKAFLTALASCSHDRALSCPAGVGVHASRSLEGRGRVPLPSAHFAFFLSLTWTCRGPCSAAASLPEFLEQRAYLFHLQACLSVVQLTGSVRKPLNNGWDLRKLFGIGSGPPSLVSCPSAPCLGLTLL